MTHDEPPQPITSWRQSLKAGIAKRVSAQNATRARILVQCVRELRRTLHQAPLATYPISVAEIRSTLEEMGVSRGDVIHVQGSITHLLRASVSPPLEPVRGQLSYAKQIIEMLIDLVGEMGTITMNTDFQRPAGWFKRLAARRELEDDIFDPAASPSRRGVISEYFRRRHDVLRSVHPYYNVTAWGRLAEELVRGHHLSSPYAQDRNSPWFKLTEAHGKVLLLGRTFDVNSLVHLVEYLHPQEFPRPVFLAQPICMPYLDGGGTRKCIEVLLHTSGAPGEGFFRPDALFKFGLYIKEKYGVYQIRRFAGDSQIVVYDAKAQYEAFYQEMKNNVTWYDPQFLP